MCALVASTKSERLFRNISGIVSVYKPASMHPGEIVASLKDTFAKALNERPTRPVESMVKVDEEKNSIYIAKNLADSPLAVGPRFIPRDFDVYLVNPLSKNSSGVQMISVNEVGNIGQRIHDMRLMKVYHVQGRLGVATDNFSPDGRVVEKSTYNHVTRPSIDRIMSAAQSTYQREMYKYFGIDIRSQAAFELASTGLLRPVDDQSPPIIYSIRCIKFYRPFFTVEIHIINESSYFFKELLNDVGIRLKTNAICTQIRRIRDGFVDINNSLVYIDFANFDKIYANMKACNKLVAENLSKYENTIVAGKTKLEEMKILKQNLK